MQMADKIVLRSVESLIPYARNARTHSDAQVAQIAGSIREFGFTNPVLVDGENGIVAGHGRVLAARKLGLTEVPCIEVAYLTDAQQRRAYIGEEARRKSRLVDEGSGHDQRVELLLVEPLLSRVSPLEVRMGPPVSERMSKS